MKKAMGWALKSAPICVAHELLCLALSLKVQEKVDPVAPSFPEVVINQYLDRIAIAAGSNRVRSIGSVVAAKTLLAFIEKELTDVIDASAPFWRKGMKEREQKDVDIAIIAQKAFSSFRTDLSKKSMADIVSSRLGRYIGSSFNVIEKEIFSPSVWKDLITEVSSFRIKYDDFGDNVVFRTEKVYSFRAVLDNSSYYGAAPYLHYILIEDENKDSTLSAITSSQKSKSLTAATNSLISKLNSSSEFAVYEKAYDKKVADSLCLLCAALLYSPSLYWLPGVLKKENLECN